MKVKASVSLLLVLSVFLGLTSSVFADGNVKQRSNEKIESVQYFIQKDNPVYSVQINEELKGNLNDVLKSRPEVASQLVTQINSDGFSARYVPQPGWKYYYIRDDYEVTGQTNYVMDIGPREKETFLLSVAKGKTLTLTSSKTVSGTLSIAGEAGVASPIAKIISLKFTGSISGTISKTWGTTTSYTGPTGNFNSRNYYGGINYDGVTALVKITKVYQAFDANGSNRGEVTDTPANVTVSGVKIPKAIEWSVDVNY